MLTLLLIIPLLGSLIILPIKNILKINNQMKKIALTTSLINFFISLFLWYEFDSSCATQFQFVSEFNQLSFSNLKFGVYGILLYIFFESVLPVLFIVIVIFGHGKDRFRSAFLFFLYTLAGSLPMLLSILVIYSYIGNTDFQLISLYDISLESQKFLWLGFFVAFAVKTPLYPFIIWLPKAHSDSPLAGSILLAATILKLATYGYLRVLINLLPDATNY